jgi:zinc transporter ZupT
MTIHWVLPTQALLYGLLSALSLPLGAMLGLCFKSVSPHTTGCMMAFGSGAIVFAVATQLYGDALSDYEDSRIPGCEDLFSPACSDAVRIRSYVLLVQIGTGILGAVIYYFLNRKLQSWAGHTGDAADKPHKGSTIRRMTSQHSIVTAVPDAGICSFSAPASTGPTLLPMLLHDRRAKPLLPADACAKTRGYDVESRGENAKVSSKQCFSDYDAKAFKNSQLVSFTSNAEISLAPKVPGGGARVAMSMWLGVALDGIPEALMLGLMVNQREASWYFLAAIFIANFPESFSAAILLREHGVTKLKIIGMWGSIFLMTGILSFLGSMVMPQRPCGADVSLDFSAAAMEGLTSGAMFAMVATAMIPEAFHGAGEGSGLPFVLGFLASCLLQIVGIQFRGVVANPCKPRG